MAQGKAPQDFKGTASGGGNEYSITFTGPDWAKEATQALIDKKLGSIDKKLNASGGLGKMLKAALDKNTEAIKSLQGQQKKDNTNDDKHQAQTKKHQNKTQKAEEALQKSTTSMDEGIAELIKLSKQNESSGGGDGGAMGTLRQLGGKISPLAMFGQMVMKTIKKLAGFVGAIASAAGAIGLFIGRQLMKTFNLMNDSLSNGTAGLVGAYTDGATNIATQASLAGLSLKDFTEALQETSEEIMVLGAEGYRELRNATRDMAGGLFDMGYQNEEMTKLLGREISIRARLGMRLDAEGTNLAGNVVEVARTLRNVGKAAGIAEEELYERAKLEDETNTLIAARARELGDDGISELQTSIRKLSIKMVGLSPTYAGAITSPLINAVITGAVGLDEGFTDLVTVFPGLVDSMDMAQSDIVNSGKLTDDTINNIMESLVDTTEDEFNRARQLALMTRSQTAIQAVNFASEARARRALLSDLTEDGDAMRNISLISAQADTFFDMMKAPFENAIMQFTMGMLGVSSTGEGANFGTLLKQLGLVLEDFTAKIPLVRDLFVGSGFFARLNDSIDAYFNAGDAQQRADASKRLQNMFIEFIDTVSGSIGDAAKAGVLGDMIANMFRNLMDQIVLAIYEGTDGKFFKESAGEAYIRSGQFSKARRMNDRGLLFGGGGEGEGARHGPQGMFNQLYFDNFDAIADQFNVRRGDVQTVNDPKYGVDQRFTDRVHEVLAERGLSPDEITLFVKAAREAQDDLVAVMADFGLGNIENRTYATNRMLIKGFEDNNKNVNEFLQYYAQNKNLINRTIQTASFTDFDQTENPMAGNVALTKPIVDQLDLTIDTIRNRFSGTDGLLAATAFKDTITQMIANNQINVSDGIDRNEQERVSKAVVEQYKKIQDDDKMKTDNKINLLLAAMERLIVKIEDKPGVGST